MDSGRRCRAGEITALLIALHLLGFSPCTGETRPPSEKLPADFQPTVPGSFPPPQPLKASYRFGWAAVPAAAGSAKISRKGSEIRFHGDVHTEGLVRKLWKLDATLDSRLNAATLRPLETDQVEVYRTSKKVTHVAFAENHVIRQRQKIPDDPVASRKRFKVRQPLDIFGALLTVRSRPLKTGEVCRMIVFPSTSAYLAEIESLGREKIEVRAGMFDAIKIGLRLRALNSKGHLEPYGKFKRATGWISDDDQRLLLRIESDIFIGSVWAELESIEFDRKENRQARAPDYLPSVIHTEFR